MAPTFQPTAITYKFILPYLTSFSYYKLSTTSNIYAILLNFLIIIDLKGWIMMSQHRHSKLSVNIFVKLSFNLKFGNYKLCMPSLVNYCLDPSVAHTCYFLGFY